MKLSLSGGPEAFSGPIRIVGESTGDAGPFVREVRAAIPNRSVTTADLWLTVVPAGK